MKISAKIGRGENVQAKLEIDYDMPKTLAELVEKFGEDNVYEAACGDFVISLQNVIRANIHDTAAAQAAVNAWVPGARSRGTRDPLKSATNALSKLSEEDRKALLAQLQAQLAG